MRIAVASDGVEGTILYRDSEKDEFKPFIEMEAGDEVMPLASQKTINTFMLHQTKVETK